MALASPYATQALLSGIASLGGNDDNDTRPKKPALYRAGRNLRQGGQVAGAAVNAFDNSIQSARSAVGSAVKQGIGDFTAGLTGQPQQPAAAAPVATPAKPSLSVPANYSVATGGTGVGSAPAPKLTAPAAPTPGLDSGVTLPDGRKLPYGAMVNGVPTFSDGSSGIAGRPGTIPRTMTDKDIAALGDHLNTVPATAFTNPSTSEAMGGAPSSESRVATLVRNAQGPKFAATPEMFARADLDAAARRDFRSPVGIAAGNLETEAQGARTVLQRKAALDNLEGFEGAVARHGEAGVNNAATLQRGAQGDAATLAAEDLRGQYGLADTRLRTVADLARLQPQQVVRADGTVALVDPLTNRATTLLDSTGKAVKVPTTKTGGLTDKDVTDAATKMLSQQPQLFGLSPEGQVLDPTTNQYRPLTQQERNELMQQARAMVTPQGVASAKPTYEQFAAAVKARGSKLSDEQLRRYYSQNYGS